MPEALTGTAQAAINSIAKSASTDDALAASFRLLARYNAWFNQRLYAACDVLDDAARRADRGAFFGSIHGTLAHVLWGDLLWLGRFAAQAGSSPLLQDPWCTMPAGASQREGVQGDWAALRLHRATCDDGIERWCAGLGAVELAATMRYATLGAIDRVHPTWQALTHLFNHQTHHRGQVTALLAQAGVAVGATDLVAML